MAYILSADIGGTKLATALFNSEQKIVQRQELPSEKNDGEQLFIQLIESFFLLCEEQQIEINEIEGVAVGLPGLLNIQEGIVLFQNNLPWRDFPLVRRLQEFFPQAKIFMEKDVDMAAIGEYAVRQYKEETFIYATLSTGISCSTIVQNRIIHGAGMAGEIGFTLTGKELSLEQFVAGPALEHRAREAFGDTRELKDYMEDYYYNHPKMQVIIDDAMEQLAKALFQLFIVFDPHTIVLGGGIFNHHPLLIEKVKGRLKTLFVHPLLAGKESRVEGSINKGEAGLVGAASRVTM
ncbi:ROK family protein [Solibacillus sp. CAU 1738]|uniref:ROK family protein n=1 Tax=Solibacillus sp. CAU 1738 TaxID=3140363 RepID=UPI00326046BD